MPNSLAESKPYGNKNLNRVSYYVNMDEMTQHRKRRLQALIDSQPFVGSQKDFANAIGVNKSRVSQMLDPDKPFGERAAKNICESLGLPHRHFDEGFDLSTSSADKQEASNRNTVNLSSVTVILVPYLTKAEAGMYREFLSHRKEPSRVDMMSVPPGMENIHAFSVTIEDDVMEPMLMKGWDVVIGAGLTHESGDAVFVEEPDGWLIRRLLVDGEHLYIDSPRTPPRPLTGKIVGPVISVVRNLINLQDRNRDNT